MRIIKWVFVGLAAVVLGLAMLWVLIPKERIINFALAQVQAQTGRAVRVDGDSDLRIFPNIAVVADQISVANADWSDRGPMLSADRLDVSISAIALLRGDIVMSRMTLIRPEILLERHANGSANWDLGADGNETPEIADASDEQSKPGSTSPDIPIIEIPIAELIDGQLRFVDYGTGQDITLSAITAEVRVPALDQPIAFVGELTYGARPIMASLSTQFPSELGPDTQVPISAEISVTEAGTLSFEGFASLGGDVSGQFDVDLSSTQAFLSAFDVVATGLSKNLGAQIDASTNLSFDVGAWRFCLISAKARHLVGIVMCAHRRLTPLMPLSPFKKPYQLFCGQDQVLAHSTLWTFLLAKRPRKSQSSGMKLFRHLEWGGIKPHSIGTRFCAK